jgi:hypothetical protein
VPLTKPVRRAAPLKRKPPKEMMDTTTGEPTEQQSQAAARAEYLSSEYHRPAGSAMGSRTAVRNRFASKCDPKWTLETATLALKSAILQGRVSTECRGIFPRYAWHQDGDTVYQAVLSNEEQGHYHAYPLESSEEWPKGMR